MAVKTRDPVKTRAHILEVAFGEIYQRGFQGVSVRDIASKAELTIGAFFHYFPTKNDVGYAIIDEFLKAGILNRWIAPLAAYKNPLQGILKTYKKTFEQWPDENIARGCPLNNLAQEMSNVDPLFREKAHAVIDLWMTETEKYLKKAQHDGYLKPSANARELAEFIVTVQEGAFAMSKTMNDRRIIHSLYNSLRDALYAKAQSPHTLENDNE